MDIKKKIMEQLKMKGEVRASDIVKSTGLSRAYINRFFRELRDEGLVLLVGRANRAKYIPATQSALGAEKKNLLKIHRILHNDKNLQEDIIFSGISKNTDIFAKVTENVAKITEYAFTEILNNAIEHSRSKKIEIRMEAHPGNIVFTVIDKGVGIFNNIMKKKNLNNEMEAIQDLLKGKLSTAPAEHSGEGIFFTSKVADLLTIHSSTKKVLFNNLIDDVFVKTIKPTSGTKVNFSIDLNSSRKLADVFRQYTDDAFQFSKTKVTIKLFKSGAGYISRSQARRILVGLEKFKTVILDFEGIDAVGQAFADEVFRIWKARHKHIDLITKNANKDIVFMLKRASEE